MHKYYLFLVLNFFLGNLFAQEEARLLRFPAIYGNQIVFSAGNDLYTVSKTGGLARRLTHHAGFEIFPRFSPDGKTIAFTGQYDGNTEVFTIPAQGGEPKRLTFTATLSRDELGDRVGPNNIVMGWSPDGQNVIYRSRCYTFNQLRGQLFTVSSEGGLPKEIPLKNGGFCSYSPDGKKLAFNRVFREFRTWKGYKGGMADDIWIYDFESKNIENITQNDSQDIIPMWHGDNIYFLSEKEGRMNLYVYSTTTKQTRKLTNYTDFDVKFPSIGNESLIFEKGGYLFVMDLKTEKIEKVTIQIANDGAKARNEFIDASRFINDYEVSPDGSRVILGARGDIFTLPAEHGIIRNLTKSSNANDRNAVWSPDGKYIAYISDRSGEYQIYMQKSDGSESPIQLTKDFKTYIFEISWSPDSKKILWNDREQRLQYLDIDTKKVTIVDKSDMNEFDEFNWSPDSQWITYVKNQIQGYPKIYIYNLKTAEKQAVTDGWYKDEHPAFSSDGKYLVFASERDFNPTYSSVEWNFAYTGMERIYLMLLSKDTPSPFGYEKDEKKEESSSKAAGVKIDFEGIENRVIALPVPLSNSYNGISVVDDCVYYVEGGNIKMYNIASKEEIWLGSGDYVLSADKKKILVHNSVGFGVIDLPKARYTVPKYVDLLNFKIWVNKDEEWKQIFEESWRQMRDFFAYPNMNGVDWNAIHDLYAPMVSQIRHRDDLTYIISEMIGELCLGHCYVSGGHRPAPQRYTMGLLGAKLEKDASGYYKIVKILEGSNWNKSLRSPLAELGVNVKEGEFITAINGQSTKNMNNIYQAFIGTEGVEIELSINGKPSEIGSHKEIVVPIGNESALYYYNWVQNNIRKVDKATNGQVGYIHIPDMLSEGLNEFVKNFYPQLNKKALIIDDRGNAGGNVSPMIIERLRREVSSISAQRGQTAGNPNPMETHVGAKIMLIDNYSASDGDLFPFQFKYYKLGKVIGKRSWGGVTGIRGTLPFIDGGVLNRPEFARYSVDGKEWIVENHGVDPDIEIDNNPSKDYLGEDEQLNKAIEISLEEIKNFKGYIKPIPDYPDKNKKN